MPFIDYLLTVATLGANKRVEHAADEQKAAIAAYESAIAVRESEHKVLVQALEHRGEANQAAYAILQRIQQMMERFERGREMSDERKGDESVPFSTSSQIQEALAEIDAALNIAVGTGTGVLATAGAWGAVSAFGTATTGAAIGGLHGVAAHSAALAWFGGGAAAAGGGGMAVGAAVLSGFAAVALLGVTGGLSHWKANKEIAKIRANITEIGSERSKIEGDIYSLRLSTRTAVRLTDETRSRVEAAEEGLLRISRALDDLDSITADIIDLVRKPALAAADPAA
jgi:hypothetical protein